MDIALWIIVCMLAAVGFVQLAGWLVCQIARPRGGPRGYYILSLPREKEALESRLRHGLLCRDWGAGLGGTFLLLVDNGLDEEGQEIVERMLKGRYGVLICTPETLGSTVARFDDLQTSGQRV